jgi:hypothetical protein
MWSEKSSPKLCKVCPTMYPKAPGHLVRRRFPKTQSETSEQSENTFRECGPKSWSEKSVRKVRKSSPKSPKIQSEKSVRKFASKVPYLGRLVPKDGPKSQQSEPGPVFPNLSPKSRSEKSDNSAREVRKVRKRSPTSPKS